MVLLTCFTFILLHYITGSTLATLGIMSLGLVGMFTLLAWVDIK